MNFEKYHTITNTYDGGAINSVKAEVDQNEWYVTEKIHGANFCIMYETAYHEFDVCSRNEIATGTNFMGCGDDILARYREGIVKYCDNEDIKTIKIIGELFGGSYPHEDVKHNPNAKKVQRNIYYTPNNEFWVFDIIIDGVYADTFDIMYISGDMGMTSVPVLHVGTFDECLNYPNDAVTTIPALFKLPPIDNNIAEGTVIRPNKTMFYRNDRRVIFKNKNEKWLEISPEEKARKYKTVENQSAIDEHSEELLRYITVNRYNAITSKMGEVSESDIGSLIGMFQKDVMQEYIELHPLYEELDKKTRKYINKRITPHIVAMIKREMFRVEYNVLKGGKHV